MRLKIHTGNRGNKRGSYIVEASISLPIFLIAMLAMSSIILMYSCIEDANYIVADELGRASIEAIYLDTSFVVPSRVKKRIRNNQSMVEELRTTDYVYRGDLKAVDELIALTMEMRMNSSNPLGFASQAEYTVSCVTRAYVGKIRDEEPMSDSELSGTDSDAVFIFPARGEKYHKEGCGVLHATYIGVILSKQIKSKYRSCKICRSKSAGMGSLVYVFPDEGENYHLSGCEILERNYIEVERQTAIKRGYRPCLKCGG